MNHCRTCNSDYEKPGTCNCFAPQRTAPAWVPYVPPPTWYPAYPYPWWQPGTWISTSGYAVTLTTTAKDDAPTVWLSQGLDRAAWVQSMGGGDTSHMIDA